MTTRSTIEGLLIAGGWKKGTPLFGLSRYTKGAEVDRFFAEAIMAQIEQEEGSKKPRRGSQKAA